MMKCWRASCRRIIQVPDPVHDISSELKTFRAHVTCTCGATYVVETKRLADRIRKVNDDNQT